MKLEKGMYCRTENGLIGKVISNSYEYKDDVVNDIDFGKECYNTYELYYSIIKTSHNIIDLIEVGDVVVDNSGRKLEVNLIRVWNDEKEIICNDYNLDDSALTLHNGGIFKILTKEQFENNCFRIGE